MNDIVAGIDKINLATMYLLLCEDVELHCTENVHRLKQEPKEKSFETDITLSNDCY